MKLNLSLRAEVALAFVICGLLTLLTFRAGPLLTFDGYHYCEFAKLFSTTWPDRFGNHWPFGWPLAGGLLARLGVPAYPALIALSALSAAALLTLTGLALKFHPLRLLVLVAVGAAPILAPQFGGVLTELPFAAALLGVGVCLSQPASRSTLWGAAACAVLSLVIRYAGLVALAMIAMHVITNWRTLREAKLLKTAIAAMLAGGLVSAMLLGLNVLKSGSASGADRGSPPGLIALPQELASFGWSAPSALINGGLRDRVGPTSMLGWTIGGVCIAGIAALCAWAWSRPRSACSRPLAVVALGYSVGMAVLHCIGDFDSLYNARTFLPALAPLAILAADQIAGRTWWTVAGCALVITTGVTAASRGISREIGGDVRPVIADLKARLHPGDHVVINDFAMSLSAYIHQPTDRMWAEAWAERPERAFVVAAGKPTDRNGHGALVPPEWSALAERLVATGRYRYLAHTPELIALERTAKGP